MIINQIYLIFSINKIDFWDMIMNNKYQIIIMSNTMWICGLGLIINNSHLFLILDQHGLGSQVISVLKSNVLIKDLPMN
jgi:hypothetical protein